MEEYVRTYYASTRSQRIEALVNVAMISFVLPKEKRPVSASQRDEVSHIHNNKKCAWEGGVDSTV